MIKTKVSIERVINDRQFQFMYPYESSLSECAMITEDVLNYLKGRIQEEEKKAQDAKEAADGQSSG